MVEFYGRIVSKTASVFTRSHELNMLEMLTSAVGMLQKFRREGRKEVFSPVPQKKM